MIGSYSSTGTGKMAPIITVDKALTAAGVTYTFLQGCAGKGPPNSGCDDLPAAVALAEQSDVR
jgi:hypothetical protein